MLVEIWKRSLIKFGEWRGIEDTWLGYILRRVECAALVTPDLTLHTAHCTNTHHFSLRMHAIEK